MRAGIVGLGLIGGSFAKAYSEAGHEVLAFDRDESVLSFAQIEGAVSAPLTKENIGTCDIVLVAIYPEAAIAYVTQMAPYIGKKPMVIDCCGTKRVVCRALFPLAQEHGFTYLGGHPMAGTHNSGFKYARANLYHGAPMVLVPPVFDDIDLLQRAKEAWYDADAKTWKEGKKYLQVSTDEVYGALGAEGFFMETTPLCPHSPYSSSKASADMFVMAFHDTYGMPINITRCSNNYGPYQFPEKLIPLMINNVKHHKQLPVYGDGMQIRDWLYVEDHCKAIDMVCNGGKIGEVYNVGGHNERPNIFIVKTIIAQLHDRLKDDGISEDLIKHVADRLGHDRRYGIDPTKIKKDLGWYPETPFEKGIVLTIDWYLDHEEWMEHITSGNYQKYYEEMYKNK